jgi:hypothetical protein
VRELGAIGQLPQAIADETALGVRDPRTGAHGPVDAQEGLQGGLVVLNLISAWRSCLRRARA